jgi:hypothetical protein
MKHLTVAFSRPRDKWAIGSYFIRAFEHAPFSHALIRWHSDSVERDMVYQASHGMVHFIEGSRFDADVETVVAYEIELTDDQHKVIIQKAVDLAGVKYGTLTLFGIAFERITGIKNPFRDGEHSFVCSELVGTILKLCEGTVPLDLELAGPRQLEIWVAALPNARKIK